MFCRICYNNNNNNNNNNDHLSDNKQKATIVTALYSYLMQPTKLLLAFDYTLFTAANCYVNICIISQMHTNIRLFDSTE
jgi:hypothetical protein